MKEKTKDNIKTGAVVLGGIAALYFLMPRDEGVAGFGGGGGIPLIPGDTEDSAEGDTVINYIIEAADPFGGFGDDEEADTKKAEYIKEFGYPESVMQQVIAGEAIYEPTEYPIRYGAADVAEDLAKAGITPDKQPTVIESAQQSFTDFWGMSGAERGIAARETTIESAKVSAVEYKKQKAKETGYKATALDTIFGFFTGKELGAEDVWAEARAAEKADVMDEIAKSSVGRTAQFKASTPRAPSGVFEDFRKQFAHAQKLKATYAKKQYTTARGGTVLLPGGLTKEQLEGSGSGVSYKTYTETTT